MLEGIQRFLTGSHAAFPGRRTALSLATILIATLCLTPIFGQAPALTLAFFSAGLLKRRWAVLIFAAFAIVHAQWVGWFQAVTAACVFLVAHGLRKWVRQPSDATILASCLTFPIVIVAGWAPLGEALRWAAAFVLGTALADLAVAAAARGNRAFPRDATLAMRPVAALTAIINILTVIILDLLARPLPRPVDETLAFTFIDERLTLPALLILTLVLQFYSRQLSHLLEGKPDDEPTSSRPHVAGSAVPHVTGAATYDGDRTGVFAQAPGMPNLRSISRLSFDAQAGRLDFSEGTAATSANSLQIHIDDVSRVIESVDRGDTILRFQANIGSDLEPMLLAMTGRTGKWHWESGILLHHNHQWRHSIALARRARHAELGARVMTIAHELRQPLCTIAVAAENQRLILANAAPGKSAGQLAERIERITEQVNRATTIIEQILNYGRTSASTAAEVDVAETLRRCCGFLAPIFEEHAIELDFSIENGWHGTIMPPVELEQVFVNALQNAVDSIVSRRHAGWTEAGRITCSVVTCDGFISCIIADNGAGLSECHAGSAFDAFFSTKAEEGTGLGLFISREIILRAGGQVSLRPSSEGALLAIQLPATTNIAQMSARASRIVN